MDFLVSKTPRNKFVLFISHLVDGNFLTAPKESKTGSLYIDNLAKSLLGYLITMSKSNTWESWTLYSKMKSDPILLIFTSKNLSGRYFSPLLNFPTSSGLHHFLPRPLQMAPKGLLCLKPVSSTDHGPWGYHFLFFKQIFDYFIPSIQKKKKLSKFDLKIKVHQFEMQSPHSHCCPLQSQPSFRYHFSLYFIRYYLLWKSSFFNILLMIL